MCDKGKGCKCKKAAALISTIEKASTETERLSVFMKDLCNKLWPTVWTDISKPETVNPLILDKDGMWQDREVARISIDGNTATEVGFKYPIKKIQTPTWDIASNHIFEDTFPTAEEIVLTMLTALRAEITSYMRLISPELKMSELGALMFKFDENIVSIKITCFIVDMNKGEEYNETLPLIRMEEEVE